MAISFYTHTQKDTNLFVTCYHLNCITLQITSFFVSRCCLPSAMLNVRYGGHSRLFTTVLLQDNEVDQTGGRVSHPEVGGPWGRSGGQGRRRRVT